MSGGRFERALAAFLGQEFGSSVAAIIGFLDILIEDAQQQDLGEFIADLERMRLAGARLSALIADAVSPSRRIGLDRSQIRHDLRTPLNAIKGYGELLVEELRESGQEASLEDFGQGIGPFRSAAD